MNQKNAFLGLALLSTFFVSACAHHKDVRAGADGIHRVVINTDDKEEGAREAIRQANHFCEQRNMTAAFVNEDTQYKGDMAEKDYNNAKKVSKAAQIIGGTTYTMGGKNESNLGGVVGLGGTVANTILGKGYNVEMKFKCL